MLVSVVNIGGFSLQVEEDDRKKKRMERFNMKTTELSAEVCCVECMPPVEGLCVVTWCPSLVLVS